LQEALAISRGVSQGEVLRADTVRLRKDGRPVFVELMVFPVRIGDEHIGDYVSYRDMTERKRAEDELRQSEEKFRAAFEGSHDAITINAKEGNVLDCNRRALEVLGLASKEDFRDRRPSDFSPPFQPDGRASRAAAREKVHRVLERGVLSRFDWLHQRPNGETFPAEILLTSYRRGRNTVLQATIRDISERKRMEEKLRRREKGRGSTFTIYLPASGKQVEEEKELLGDLVKGEGTLLLVDDEEMVLEVAKPMLEALGYEVILARSGKEAIEVYKDNMERIKMVILDMIMPQMGGGETFDHLKAINPGLKVLLSSGYSINGQAQEILSRGCRGFIQKPFRLSELSQKISQILEILV